MTRAPTAPAALARDLGRLGVCAGDTMMVHASLRAIGPVDGGASGVVEALRSAVGDAGTLVMIVGAEVDWYTVDRPPRAPLDEIIATHAPFDPLATAAMREVGALAEVFRQSPGVRVTDHPDGRFAAWGADAEALLADTPWDDYYGPGSVLERLYHMGGRVLRMGADLDTVTALHYAEYLADLPHKRSRTLYFLVRGASGPEVRAVTSLDNAHGIVDCEGEDYFARILRAYLATGRAARGPVGGAGSELIDARDVVDFAARWIERHLRG